MALSDSLEISRLCGGISQSFLYFIERVVEICTDSMRKQLTCGKAPNFELARGSQKRENFINIFCCYALKYFSISRVNPSTFAESYSDLKLIGLAILVGSRRLSPLAFVAFQRQSVKMNWYLFVFSQ